MKPEALFKYFADQMVPNLPDAKQMWLGVGLTEALSKALLENTFFQEGPGADARFTDYQREGVETDMAVMYGVSPTGNDIESEAEVAYPQTLIHEQELYLPVLDIFMHWWPRLKREGLTDKTASLALFKAILFGEDKRAYRNAIEQVAKDVLTAKFGWVVNKYAEMYYDVKDELFSWPDGAQEQEVYFTWKFRTIRVTDVAFANADKKTIRVTIRSEGYLAVDKLSATFDQNDFFDPDDFEMGRYANLRSKLIRLAHTHPEYRTKILPLLKK